MRSRLFVAVALMAVPASAWPQGNPVGPEFRVNTFVAGLQGNASVADSSGGFVVVWSSGMQDGDDYGVFAQRYAPSGAPLGPEFRVNTLTLAYQGAASVATNPSGDFVVVWQSRGQDGSGFGIFGQRYGSTGTPLGPEFRVNTYTIGYQIEPAIAADPSGNFVVVWTSFGQDGDAYGVFGQRYATSGAPLGSEFRVNTYTTADQYAPSVAADGSGNFVVAWHSFYQDGSLDGVFGQRYEGTGAVLGPEFRVNTYTTNSQWGSSVAADSAGSFLVVWQSFGQDGSNHGIFGQRYDSAGAAVGSEFRVNTYTMDDQIRPSVAADSSGNFVVVWEGFGQDGSDFDVFGQRYAASGTSSGPEFRINTYTTIGQSGTAVAADSTGRFVVVWQSYGQDGSSAGVFGQRYNMIVPVELMHFGVE